MNMRGKRKRLYRYTRAGYLALAILLIVSTLLPTTTFAYSTIHGEESWLQSTKEQVGIKQEQQALYFGVIEGVTNTGYKVKGIHMEVSYGDGLYDYDQDADIIDVVVRNHTDVVTLDGSRKLSVQTPVVVAGFQQSNGSVEALVIGDMQTAEMIQQEVADVPTVEELESEIEEFETSVGNLVSETERDASGTDLEGEQTNNKPSAEISSFSLEHFLDSATDKRYTSVGGDFSKSFQWKKNIPAFKVGSLLTISLYMEVFSGVDMNWDFPFEVQASLLDPIRYITRNDTQYLPGETWEERYQRLHQLKAMLRVGIEPMKHSKNRTLFAQAGVKLNVGFEGSIAGHSFNEKIDLLKLASGVVGGGGLSMQVGGKHAAPLFGEQATFGIRDKIGFDEDTVKCSISCTFDLFTEDSVGITLPFFEAGIFTMGFEIQPLILVYGDYPKIKQIETSPGLTVEAGYLYDYGLNHGSTFPVNGDTPIYPYDSLYLYVNDIFTDEGNFPPPQLADENGTFDLSFKVDYQPRAMVGLFYQATMSAKKLGIGAKVKLPMMALPIPFDFDLQKIGGGTGLSALSCTTKELTLSGCTESAFQFDSSTIIQPIGLQATELAEAVSGTTYESGEIKAYGGTGNISLKVVGLLPKGLRLQRIGSDEKGNDIYQLVGKPNVKEGRYAIKLQASDSEGAKKTFELSLGVNKIYPERIDTELIPGQLWSQQLKLVGTDGTLRNDVTWTLEGNLPASSYELGSNGALRTVPSDLVPGNYTFTITAELDDLRYSTDIVHRFTVLQPDVAAERNWSVERVRLGSNNALYGTAAWHEGLGQVALISQSQGAMLYDGEIFNAVAQLPYPYHASLAYAYPNDPEESGWMYIFGGANKAAEGEFAGNVFRWDEDGIQLLYSDPLDGSGPTVYDAATAALPDGRLVVFGGDYAGKFTSGAYDPKLSDETWLFDPASQQFTKVNSEQHPGARSGNQIMTYVPELGKVVLFGEDLNNKAFLPEEREQEIWLFDPNTLQWSKADGGSKLVLNEDEGTRLVYSRAEQKLFILVADTTPIYKPDGQSAAQTRFYSIDVSTGTLGSLLDESAKLPQVSQSWGRSKGRLAYNEQQGSLLYLQDSGLANTDIWSYALAQADSDRQAIIADGQDRASFQFNVTRYLQQPEEWRVSWQNIGHPNVLDGEAAVITTPDAQGNVALEIAYDNYAMVKHRAGTLLLIAEHVSDGREVPIGFATVGLMPVPPDSSNSVIQLAPAAVDYMGDFWANGFDSRQTQLTITLRSAGEYMDGASAENGDYKGKPLPGRKLELLDSLQLENRGLRFYTGPVTDQMIGAADYDESKFLLDFDGYVRNMYTDENGQVTLTLVDWPAVLAAGEYPFAFELADGSGFALQHSLSVVPRQLKARQTAYQFDTWTSDWFSGRIALDGLDDWRASSCSAANSFSCFKLVSGALPDGVTLNPQTGVISGLPKAKGTYVAGIRLPNRSVDSADVTITIRVLDPLSLDVTYRNWEIAERVGEPFSYSLDEQVKGGIGPFTYELVEGELPPGIELEEDENGQLTGFLSGTFTGVYEGSAKIKITESGLPTRSRNADTDTLEQPRSVEKTLQFNIYPPDRYATSFSSFDKVHVSSEANLWVSGLEGIPVGSPEGVFEPYGKNQYYELIRFATTHATEFQLQYSDDVRNLRDDLVLYYWHPAEGSWKKFHEQEFTFYNYSRVIADVSGAEELEGAWQRSEERFMNFYDYDRLYIAVGKEAMPTPEIDAVSAYFHDEKGFEEIDIEGRYFTEHAKVYVGGRESLFQYISCSKGYDEERPENLCLTATIPPGYGTKDVIVVDRGGTSNAVPYTYALSHKFPAYDLQLRMKVQSKQELDELESGNPYPDMLDNAQLITVELLNGEGERQSLDDVLLKGSPACESLDAAEQEQCFDPTFTLKNWSGDDYSTEALVLTCERPESGQFNRCVVYTSDDGNLVISGELNEDGTFQAMLNRFIDSCDSPSCGSGEGGEPSESYPGAAIDLTISNEDGYYGRLTGNAPIPDRTEYADDAAGVTDMLRITTEMLPSIDLDDSPELYEVALSATGGRGSEHYRWYWGGDSDIPPGIVLDTESGQLRASGQLGDPESPPMKPGTYLSTIVVSDGIVQAARTFTFTVTGSPEQDIVLQELVVHGGDAANPYLLSEGFDAAQSSYSLDVPFEEQKLYVAPILGDYTVNGEVVTDGEYERFTEVRVNGSLVSQREDGSYAIQLGTGWTHVSVSALVRHNNELVAARAYTVLIARSPSTELERLLLQVSGTSEVTELQVQGNNQELNVDVPYDTGQIVIRPYQVDSTASLEMVVDGDVGNRRFLTSGAMTAPIELSDQLATQLEFILMATDRNGAPMQNRYMVTVNRVLSDDATLQQLAFTPDLLAEHFIGQSVLQGEVAHEQEYVQLLAKAADDGATLQVFSNGQIVHSTSVRAGDSAWDPESDPASDSDSDESYFVPLQVGDNTVKINVTAENGADTKEYTVQIERLASRNAMLAALQTDSAVLAFQPELLNYEVNVAHDVDHMNVSATVADSGASLQVSVNDNLVAASGDDTYSFSLRQGLNSVKLWVTAADGRSQQLYRLSVLRDYLTHDNASNADNAQLQLLELTEETSLTAIELDQAFAPDLYEYSTETTEVVALRAIPLGDGAAIMVTMDDRAVAADDEGIYSLDAEIGEHIVDIYVASGDETNSSHYQIKLQRLSTELTDAEAPTITMQPSDITVSVEGNATLNVEASVNDGGELSYQWYSNTSNATSGGMVIDGATSATYEAPTTSVGTTYYYVEVTNTNISTEVTGSQTATTTSQVAAVTVNELTNAEAPTITMEPSDITVSVEGNATLNVEASVSDGGELSYQWYSNTSNATSGGMVIDGATNATFEAPTISVGTIYYYVEVTNTNAEATGNQTATTTSQVAAVTVNELINAEPPTITTQPLDITVNVEGNATLSVEASVNDGGELSYQWYSNTSNAASGGMVIDGATSATYEAPTISVGTIYYYVEVTNTNISTEVTGSQTAMTTSQVATVTVNELSTNVATPTATPGGGTVSSGTVVALSTTTADATIYYTTDGSTPSIDSSEYTTPIEVTAEITIKAIAMKEGMNDSEVMTEHYTIATVSVPANLTATAGDGLVTLNWDEVVGTDTVTYAIYKYEGATAPTNQDDWELVQENVTADTYVVSDLTNGTSYAFVIKAFVAEMASDFSNAATATPQASNGGEGSNGGGSNWSGTDHVISTNGSIIIPVGSSGEVSLAGEILIKVPKGAADRELHITIEKMLDPNSGITDDGALNSQLTDEGTLISQWFEVTKNIKDKLKKPASVSIKFDPAKVGNNETVSIFYYDEEQKSWSEIGGTVNGDWITAEVDHFAKFAVQAIDTKKENGEESPNEPVPSFSDISGHWAERSIKRAAAQNLVSGYPNGTFKPNAPITRAEFTVMLANVLQWDGRGAELSFKDQDEIGAWAERAIALAMHAGIINGYEDGSFRPNARITRAEMATMIARALELSLETVAATSFVDDQDIPKWAKGAVEAMHKLGVIGGRTGNQFVPNDEGTRAEATVMLLRMLEL